MTKSFYRSHKRVTLNTGDNMVTKQSHKDECDIHRILKQYQRTGIITHVQNAQAQFLDLPTSTDFQTSLNLIMEAQESFSRLPSSVRAHFNNDPQAFLAAFYDPDQVDTLRGFGLITPAEAADSPSAPNTAPPGAP